MATPTPPCNVRLYLSESLRRSKVSLPCVDAPKKEMGHQRHARQYYALLRCRKMATSKEAREVEKKQFLV
jgi:hypothetical protein